MSKFGLVALVAMLSVSLLTLPGCSSSGPEEPSTPESEDSQNNQNKQASNPEVTKQQQEIWDKFKTAMIDKKWSEAYAYLTPDSQKLLLGSFLLGGKRMVDQDPSLQPSFNALLEECGVSREQLVFPKPALEMEPEDHHPLALAVAEPIQDRPVCFQKIADWIATNTPVESQFRFLAKENYQNSKLTNVTVSRDKAYGTIVTAIPGEKDELSTETSHRIVFTMIAGTWLIDFAESDPIQPPKSAST